MASCGNFSDPVRVTDLVKASKDAASLHSKNFFCFGCAGFSVSDWRTFRPPWPTLPGPRHQPLGGSILLETRLILVSASDIGNEKHRYRPRKNLIGQALIISVFILSGDGVCQIRCADVEKRVCWDGSL